MTRHIEIQKMKTADELSRRGACRACENEHLLKFLSLGPTALANSFLSDESEIVEESVYPLDVYFCPKCSLVQLMDVIDPEVLFRDYIYVTGTSSTIREHNRSYAESVKSILGLRSGDKVAEVASNNGQLLKCFQELGCKVLGIEPATNVAAIAKGDGVPTINEFFTEETAADILGEHGRFRALIGNNVLAHVDDTVGFLKGCRMLIDEDGMLVFEVPYLGEFLERLEYDTVYHEHLCYFSVAALDVMFKRAGLRITEVLKTPVHGGSVRVHAVRDTADRRPANSVEELVRKEREEGFFDPESYRRFAVRVEENRVAILGLLRGLKAEGATIAGYGAAAKGNTFLNYCGIGTDLLDFIADRNPLKVGRLTPGSHIPVVGPEELAGRPPDYLLILAWNFTDEILRQETEFAAQGGKFVIALPEPRII